MVKKGKKPTGLKLFALRVVGMTTAFGIMYGFMTYHAHIVVARSLSFAFPGWDVSYASASTVLAGGANASAVTVVSPYEEGSFHFDTVKIEVPFLAYHAGVFSLSMKKRVNRIKDLRMVFSGGHGDMMYAFTSGMGTFGNASAAPFEAEGCVSDSAWIRRELSDDMGLTIGPTELVMSWEQQSGKLVKAQSVHTPGAGRVNFRREMVVHDRHSLLSLDESGRREVALDEWHVIDEGFVAARNRLCARKDKVTPAQFAERHMATVERLLATVGLAVDQPTRDAYRAYTENGGTLDLVVHYKPPIGGMLYDDVDMGNWVPQMQGELAVNKRAVALGLSAISPRDLPETEDDLSAFAMLQREGWVPAADLASEVASTSAAADSAAPRTQQDVATQPAPSAQVSMSAPPVDEIVEALPAAANPEATISDYRELGKQVGQQFVIHFKAKPPMRFQIVGTDGGVVKVRRRMQSGWAEHTLDRAAFDHAEPVR